MPDEKEQDKKIEQVSEKPIAESFNVVFKSVTALYKAYMPYLQNGGIFIPYKNKLQLGDRVQITVSLPNSSDEEVQKIEGSIAWITPTAAQGRWLSGVGIEFSKTTASRKLREKINSLLLENAENTAPTSTM